MNFWYCEKCGKRVIEDDVTKGAAVHLELKGYYCKNCAPSAKPAVGIATTATLPSLRPPTGPIYRGPAKVSKKKSSRYDNEEVQDIPQKKLTTLHLGGIGGGVAALLVLLFLALRGLFAPPDKTRPAQPERAKPVEQAKPVAQPQPVEVAGRPEPAASPTKPEKDKPLRRVDPEEKVVPSQRETDNETRASIAFDVLRHKVDGLADDDKAGKLAVIDQFLKEHGSTIVASRARNLRADVARPSSPPPQPAPSPQPVAPAPPPSETAQTILERGIKKETEGDLDGALSDYEKALEMDSRLAVAYLRRGSMKIGRGDLEAALDDANKAVAIDTANLFEEVVRAVACYGLGRENEFRTALELAKKLHNDPGRLESQILQLAQNAKELHTGKSLEGKELVAAMDFIYRGKYRQAIKRFEQATRDYEAALKLDPSLGPKGLFTLLTQCADARKDWKAKLGYFRGWADSAANDPVALNSYAWELLTSQNEALRDYKAALQMALKATQLDQFKNCAIVDTLAMAYARNGQFKEAVSTQEKAISLLPAETLPAQRKEYEDHLNEFKACLNKPQ